jgi:hypothetical protein
LPYLYHRRWSTPHYESRLLQFRDVAEGIYYDDFRLRSGNSRKQLEESARKRLPPGLERLLEWDYIFGWTEPEETYPRVIRHLLESGFLDRYPELRAQAEAALTLEACYERGRIPAPFPRLPRGRPTGLRRSCWPQPSACGGWPSGIRAGSSPCHTWRRFGGRHSLLLGAVLEFQVDPFDWINYHDVLILHGSREEAEREVRRRKPPGADGILQAEGVLGWSDTVRVYTAALEYLEESGYLRFSWPDLREQARAALTLARLL